MEKNVRSSVYYRSNTSVLYLPEQRALFHHLPKITVLRVNIPKAFLAGALSGTCSSLLFQPLDLVKTRIQAPSAALGFAGQGHVASHCPKSLGMFGTIWTVVRTDSITGLWKGVVPTISKTVPGVGVYFCTLHWLKSFFSHDPTSMENLVLGFSARSLAGVSLLPVAVVKTRYESGQFNYKGVSHALRSIWKAEGMKGLFSGCAATVARDAPFSGLYLMFYNKAKNVCKDGLGTNELGPNAVFLCGVSAGVLASVITQPADVVKTQLQLYPSHYRGTIHCIVVVLKNNGINGFMKGMLPRCLRRTLMAALSWTVYEQALKAFGLKM